MSKNKKYAILYVDDEIHNLQTFKATFKWEFNIFTAESAFKGLDLLEKNDIQLVITDQQMAGLTGIEFLKKVKVRFPKKIRIILTGYTDLDIVVKAINDCGIHWYMTKPWKELEMKNVLNLATEFYQSLEDKEALVEQLKSENERLKSENISLKKSFKSKTSKIQSLQWKNSKKTS